MGKDRLEYHKKKRDFFLFFLLCLLILVLGSFLTLALIEIDIDLLAMIYLPLFIGVFFIITKFRQKVLFHSMYYQYFLMISDKMGLIAVPRKIFTASWLKRMYDKGFGKRVEMEDFIYFYQVVPRIKKPIYSKPLVLICVIAKTEDFDFYSPALDNEIKKIYENDKEANRARNHIVLQFKKYQFFNEAAKDELDKIINFRVGKDNLIHLNIGYFVDENAIYYLRPKKRFPSKYYYFSTNIINEYCGVI